jgi:glutamate racemase
MLGIFDSGLGGLTVLRHVREHLPDEDIVYFADQAHLPYGEKSVDELRGYLAAAVAYLQTHNVDAIVMGCNTTCAVAARFGYPSARVPILDLIDAAAHAIVASGAGRVGVLATNATVRMGAYGNAIRRLAPQVSVEEVAAPALVPLVEAGHRSGPEIRAAVAEACGRFHGNLDAVVLACTHFPLLDAEFAEVLGAEVMRIDPSIAQAECAAAFARKRGPAQESGSVRFVTTGDLTAFRRNLIAICGLPFISRHVLEYTSSARLNVPDLR